jgi:hypothetical protein
MSIAQPNPNGAKPALSKGDRDAVLVIIRRNGKVARSEIDRLEAAETAQMETLLSTRFSHEDAAWGDLLRDLQERVAAVNEQIKAEAVARGWPASFAPSAPLGWYDRGENRDPERRAELRRTGRAIIASRKATRIAKLERAQVAAETVVLLGSLSSEAAQQAVASIPTADELLPALTRDDLAALEEAQTARHGDTIAALLGGGE